MTTLIARRKGVLGAFYSKMTAVTGALVLSLGLLGGGVANAAGTVSFNSPADGSSAPVGTSITPTGIASGTGTTGSGLDLAIVIDVSGSTGGAVIAAEKAAAIALINSVPAASTSVTIVSYDSSANVVSSLTPLTPASNIATLTAAINGLSAGGGTFIGTGINAAAAELTGANATAGRSTQMVVMSDGFSSGNPALSAANAVAGGVDNVHSVAVGSGANVSQMQAIATSGNGTFIDLTSGSAAQVAAQLQAIFAGTGGSLVGVQSIAITLPDGTVIDPNSVSGIGAFTVDQAFNIGLGPNTWSVTATFTDGSTATDTVTVNGTAVTGAVPLPAGLPLMVGALGIMGALRLRRRQS